MKTYLTKLEIKEKSNIKKRINMREREREREREKGNLFPSSLESPNAYIVSRSKNGR